MDYSLEERFVRTYIRKSRQDRLLYELTSPEKRYRGLSRFCHQARDLIDRSKILMSGQDFDGSLELQKFIKQHKGNCMILSPDSFIDESSMDLNEALEAAKMSFDASIILGDDFAVIFSETEKGGRDRFLLSEKSI